MMKTIVFLGLTIAVVVILAEQVRKWTREEAAMQEVDMMLTEILSDCLEAYCEDCNRILAQGTGTRKPDVSSAAYHHSEIYDHQVFVRSWADLPLN
jgi:hypothetical protein